MMKVFTLQDANNLLPLLIPKLMSISQLYKAIDELRPSARAAASASAHGGGMPGGAQYINILYKIGKLTTEIHETGIELKDPSRGLIDFPSMRSDRLIFLCWQLGEGEEIGWWHETDGGFAGRQPI